MPEERAAVLDFLHGNVRLLTDTMDAPQQTPCPSVDGQSLLRDVLWPRTQLSRVTLVSAHFPQNARTHAETAWEEVSTIPLRQAMPRTLITRLYDHEAMLRLTLAACETLEFPYAIVVINNLEFGRDGGVRTYVVTDRIHIHVVPPDSSKPHAWMKWVSCKNPLSTSLPDVLNVIGELCKQMRSLRRVFVWSPDGLPQYPTGGDYWERPGTAEGCRVRILTDPTFILRGLLA